MRIWDQHMRTNLGIREGLESIDNRLQRAGTVGLEDDGQNGNFAGRVQ